MAEIIQFPNIELTDELLNKWAKAKAVSFSQDVFPDEDTDVDYIINEDSWYEYNHDGELEGDILITVEVRLEHGDGWTKHGFTDDYDAQTVLNEIHEFYTDVINQEIE